MPMKEQETAERRQVTILHADIVNSTAIVDHLDPEEVMGIMKRHLDTCRSIVTEFHGVLSGYTGDGFEAYFGYPAAREDSAAEALNAAVQVLRLRAGRASQLPFDCRIGIATGRVVVDQPGIHGVGRNVLAFGATPTLAARLQQSADPGGILVDNATMKLCEGKFAFRGMGPVHLKGFEDDHEVWKVVEPMRPGRRFLLSGLSPYVGRVAELQLLASRWQPVLVGEGQVVVLHGEPGLGKSRLMYEFQKSVPGSSASVFQFQCLNHFSATPLHPWIHSVERFANILQTDGADEKLGKIRSYLGGRLGFSDETVATCSDLMGLLPGDMTQTTVLSSQHMARPQGVLRAYLIAASRKAPLFIQVEDIQWIDASTMNLLQSLVEAVGTERILLIMTCRSGKVPSFSQPYVTSLSLPKLGSSAVMELIASLTSSSQHALSELVIQKIRQSSDGNPLFVEELTKHYLELATAGHLAAAFDRRDDLVPNVLQGSLMERIDNAGKCKETAQLASVVEKEFDRDILAALSGDDGETVQQHLDTLTDLRIINRFSRGKRVAYQFCHALLRDAVYSSLLKPTRRRTHRRIAEYLERGQGAVLAAPSEIIAYHYERSDDHRGAFPYWLGAGHHALRSGATEEAVHLFANALKSAAVIGEAPDNVEDMAKLHLSYGLALNATRGAGADPISHFRKAEALSAKLHNTELTLEALDWQFGLLFNAGGLVPSSAPALKMKQLGSNLNHPTAIASGCQGLGMAQFMSGNFVEARQELEFGLEAARGHVSDVHCFPSMSLSYLAWTLFVLGQRTEAEALADRAIESARQESPHGLAAALCNCCYVYQCLGAIKKVYDRTAELVEHTRKHGERMYLRRSNIIRGWADGVTGERDDAIKLITEEIDFLLVSKEEIEMTFLLALLGELQIKYGHFMDAHASLNKAFDLAHKNQEKFYLSEICRLKAKLAEIDPVRFSAADGTDYLSMARTIAETQHAKAWLDRLPAG